MYRINKGVVSFYTQFVCEKESYEEAEKYLINELGCKKVILYEGSPCEVVYYENGLKDEHGLVPRYTIEKCM